MVFNLMFSSSGFTVKNLSTRHKNSCDYHERIVTEIAGELLLFVFRNFNRKYTASSVRIDE